MIPDPSGGLPEGSRCLVGGLRTMVRTLQEIGTGIHQACEEDTKRRTRPHWGPMPDPSFAVDAMGGAVLAAAGLVYV